MKKFSTYFLAICISSSTIGYSQNEIADSVKLDYSKIYAYCLDGDVKSALKLLAIDPQKKISVQDQIFITDFENRFKYDVDKSNFLNERKSGIDSLLKMYHNYWRTALIHPDENYEARITKDITSFLENNYPFSKGKLINEDSIDVYLVKYVKSKGLHTTGYGKTGKLYDLLVWKTEKDSIYKSAVRNETLTSRVFMMEEFVTLGWEEYSTMGSYHPGGWATTEALYCVKKSYDIKGEYFLISYLAHEGRHFADYKMFPKLVSADLEYRAKLTELSLLDTKLFEVIEDFISQANYDSENGHSVANFCVIRDLSKSIFGFAFEKDLAKWKSVSKNKINIAAYKLLQANTKALQSKGRSVEKFIKQ